MYTLNVRNRFWGKTSSFTTMGCESSENATKKMPPLIITSQISRHIHEQNSPLVQKPSHEQCSASNTFPLIFSLFIKLSNFSVGANQLINEVSFSSHYRFDQPSFAYASYVESCNSKADTSKRPKNIPCLPASSLTWYIMESMRDYRNLTWTQVIAESLLRQLLVFIHQGQRLQENEVSVFNGVTFKTYLRKRMPQKRLANISALWCATRLVQKLTSHFL